MMTQKNLKQKAISGMIWTAIQKYSAMIIQIISEILLARLLTPYDYGCIGILFVFIIMAESFIDGGFGTALIQKKEPTKEDYSTIFFWNIGLAIFLYALLFSFAPTIARFYHLPLLSPLLRVQGIILIIFAFNIIQKNQLVKKLQFKVLSVVTLVTSVISLTVTIIMAYYGYGVWSLVTFHILNVAIPALFFWFYVKWRPVWTFSWVSFKDLFGFGLYVFLTNLLNTFSTRIQGLLIGKFFNPSTLGYYSKAVRTENFASTSIASVILQVAFPLFAEVQDDRRRLGNMIKKLTMTLSFITFPLLFILLLCAKPIFFILYSDRWLDCVPYFQVLCIAGLAWCLQSVNYLSIPAIGKSKTMFIWTVVKRTVGISFIIIGLVYYGMNGLLVGVVANQWFSFFVNIGLVSKYIGYKWWKQLVDILPIVFVSILIAIFSYWVGTLLQLQLYADGLVKLLVYIIIYIGWCLLFKPVAYGYCRDIMVPIIHNVLRKR